MKILKDAVAGFKSEMEGRVFPPCFDSKEQYEGWCDAEKESPTQPIRRFACRDCTLGYQDSMKLQGRCLIPAINVTKIVR